MNSREPDWLTWARELQAIAQTGLAFTRDPLDRERYEHVREPSARIFHSRTGTSVDRIVDLFARETGYATPSWTFAPLFSTIRIDCCWCARSRMVDAGRCQGVGDVNVTPAENAVKEVREKSGYTVTVTKLAAVLDRTRQGHPDGVFSCCNMYFLCELVGGEATTGIETSEVQWFSEQNIPADLSLARVLPSQITRLFEHHRQPSLATDFE